MTILWTSTKRCVSDPSRQVKLLCIVQYSTQEMKMKTKQDNYECLGKHYTGIIVLAVPQFRPRVMRPQDIINSDDVPRVTNISAGISQATVGTNIYTIGELIIPGKATALVRLVHGRVKFLSALQQEMQREYPASRPNRLPPS